MVTDDKIIVIFPSYVKWYMKCYMNTYLCDFQLFYDIKDSAALKKVKIVRIKLHYGSYMWSNKEREDFYYLQSTWYMIFKREKINGAFS